MEADSIPLRNILLTTFSNGKISLYVILIIALIALGALFAALETSLAFVNKTRIYSKADDGDKKAKRHAKVIDKSEEYIVTLLIYINIAHVLCSTFATVLAVDLLGEIGSVVSTVVITLLVFMFSETLPKNIAKENADKIFDRFISFLTFLRILIYPIVLFFSFPYKLISKKIIDEEGYSEEELSTIVDSIEEEGTLDEDESALIQSAMDFDDTSAKEVFTKLNNVKSVDINISRDEFIKAILNEEKYSRLPVYNGNKSNIIGFVNIRNALKLLLENPNVSVNELVSPIPSFKSNGKLDDLLDLLIENKTHIGVIKDKEDKIIGIVTMDDVLNELTNDMIKAGDSNE